jgi:hypothetical protein
MSEVTRAQGGWFGSSRKIGENIGLSLFLLPAEAGAPDQTPDFTLTVCEESKESACPI